MHPALQRSGIGRRLIGPSGAGPFYRKCGFKKLGHAVYRNVPLVYYELVL